MRPGAKKPHTHSPALLASIARRMYSNRTKVREDPGESNLGFRSDLRPSAVPLSLLQCYLYRVCGLERHDDSGKHKERLNLRKFEAGRSHCLELVRKVLGRVCWRRS